MISRPPTPALRPFIETLWASGERTERGGAERRELVVPTGAMHLVLRLADEPLRVMNGARLAAVGCSVIGGARTRPYVRDISRPVPTVGAMIRPGAAPVLLGLPALELAESHTRLEDIWPEGDVSRLRDRLAGEPDLSRRLVLFEDALFARIGGARPMSPIVIGAIGAIAAGRPIREIAADCGHSHRYLTTLFRREVGLGPKAYGRLVRFGFALDRLAARPGQSLANLAIEAGYADQAHFSRDFAQYAGMPPGRYRAIAPDSPRHVPLAAVDFVQDPAQG